MTRAHKQPGHLGARRRQHGVTLFVALVLLVMVTLLAVSSFRVSNTNLKIVGSMQGKSEANGAAQQAIEQVLSTPAFVMDPATTAATPIGVDINGDGTADYTVQFNNPAPKCLKSRQTNPADLDITKLSDRPCFASALITQAKVATACAETVWEVTATTTDTVTSATTTVRQGVSVRTSKTEADASCK
jgi:Tfp pilus assembly protein PilX